MPPPARTSCFRPIAVRALPPRICRHVSQRQRRHLPLLRLLGPAEARTQGLRWRTIAEGQAGGRDLLATHQPLSRDGTLIREAIEQAAAEKEGDRSALAERHASVAKEISRAERAIERYQDAFENGDLYPARFKERLSALDTRLDALNGQEQALASDLAAEAPTTPDTATLQAVADRLGHTIGHSDPDQAKALLRILIAELQVNSRSEILPTYRLSAPTVCAQRSSVGDTGHSANRADGAEFEAWALDVGA